MESDKVSSNRIDTVKRMLSGMKCKVIKYYGEHDIVVCFDDGYSTHTDWRVFSDGGISTEQITKAHELSNIAKGYLGSAIKQCCGLTAEIIAYRALSDIDIKFEDGTIRCNVTHFVFNQGSLIKTSGRDNQLSIKDEHISESRLQSVGLVATVAGYMSSKAIIVVFEDGLISHTTYSMFKKGHAKHPYIISSRIKPVYTYEGVSYHVYDDITGERYLGTLEQISSILKNKGVCNLASMVDYILTYKDESGGIVCNLFDYYETYIKPLDPRFQRYSYYSSKLVLCWFKDHSDINPSMGYINDKKRKGVLLYHCFGCGKTGHVVRLHQLIEKQYYGRSLTEVEACRDLAQRYGISLDDFEEADEEDYERKFVQKSKRIDSLRGSYTRQDFSDALLDIRRSGSVNLNDINREYIKLVATVKGLI